MIEMILGKILLFFLSFIILFLILWILTKLVTYADESDEEIYGIDSCTWGLVLLYLFVIFAICSMTYVVNKILLGVN